MSRSVQLVVLCDDLQHATFARRFLEKAGWSARRMRVELAPGGRRSAEQYVRQRFPTELKAYRSRRQQVTQALVVMVDGDRYGVQGRLKQFDKACRKSNVPRRKPDDRVAIVVPTWNIETWFAYLGGQTVDESRADYPRLHRQRDCQPYVEALDAMCRAGQLRSPAPGSLEAACQVYNSRLAPLAASLGQ